MKTRTGVALLAFALVVTGCGGFVYDKKLDGPYHLIAVDVMEQARISYDNGSGVAIRRIGDAVFAAGCNTDFVVAKRHPGNNKSVTEYYYLTRSLDSPRADPSASVTGPLTETEFKTKQKELGLPEFTIEIPSLK